MDKNKKKSLIARNFKFKVGNWTRKNLDALWHYRATKMRGKKKSARCSGKITSICLSLKSNGKVECRHNSKESLKSSPGSNMIKQKGNKASSLWTKTTVNYLWLPGLTSMTLAVAFGDANHALCIQCRQSFNVPANNYLRLIQPLCYADPF